MFDDDWEAVSIARHKKDETDKLMRLAAPREPLALGALALFLLAAAAVAAFASVERSLALPGELQRTGDSWQASLRAAPAAARRIEPGMAVRVELAAPSGAVLVLPGEAVAPVPAPATPAGARRIAVAVAVGAVPAGLSDSVLPEGGPCRIVIPLGRQSIFRALLSA